MVKSLFRPSIVPAAIIAAMLLLASAPSADASCGHYVLVGGTESGTLPQAHGLNAHPSPPLGRSKAPECGDQNCQPGHSGPSPISHARTLRAWLEGARPTRLAELQSLAIPDGERPLPGYRDAIRRPPRG